MPHFLPLWVSVFENRHSSGELCGHFERYFSRVVRAAMVEQNQLVGPHHDGARGEPENPSLGTKGHRAADFH